MALLSHGQGLAHVTVPFGQPSWALLAGHLHPIPTTTTARPGCSLHTGLVAGRERGPCSPCLYYTLQQALRKRALS